MNNYIPFILSYLFLISLAAVFLTVYDKSAAIRRKRRISESSLMITGLFGGAAAELITMKIIRHKTKHPKFMIGLPVEIMIHAACAVLIFLYSSGKS